MTKSTLLGLVLTCAQALSAPAEEWADLFPNNSFEGWVNVNTADSTWKFEDGLLVCSGVPIGEMRTERMYQNFIMEIEWRHLRPKGNAGIFIWADDITARGQPFHRGIEVQVLENDYGNNKSHTTHGDIFPIHGATMTPINGRGGSRAFPTEFRSNPSPEWNHYRITCVDGAISLAVNGKLVTQGTDCNPRKGYICLESEGGLVHYRNARIKELPDSPIEPDQVAIANRDFHALYNGIDLDNWNASEGWRPSNWRLQFRPTDTTKSGEISTGLPYKTFGLIFDLVFSDEDSSATVRFGDDPTSKLLLSADNATLAPFLEPQGQWNRFELELTDDGLKAMVNGKTWLRPTPKPNDPTPVAGRQLRFSSQGVTEWANFYIREL